MTEVECYVYKTRLHITGIQSYISHRPVPHNLKKLEIEEMYEALHNPSSGAV